MLAAANPGACEAGADPFGERPSRRFAARHRILGAEFHFDSDSEALLGLVAAAYGGLPAHRLPFAAADFRVELRFAARRSSSRPGEPPPVRTQAGAGLLCGVMDDANYALIAPAQRQALVVASADMLERPYYVRYELIEFAVFVLAARGMGLVPLHGACVGRHGRGVLLLGASGAGKSTLALHSLLEGLDFLAEDAVFVDPDRLLATGVGNYLHMKADAQRFVEDAAVRRWIGAAPVIRRRSGVEKYEADLRQGPGRLAPAPLALVGAVFVSGAAAGAGEDLLGAIPAEQMAARLLADQPYAAAQPGWNHFVRQLTGLGAYELRRGAHPREAVAALQTLLD